MRLSNRIAATALAAVMAVSMLTACGGGGGGSTGGNGNNPSSKPNNPSSSVTGGENGGNGSTGNSGSNGNDNTGSTSAWASTNTYKYNQMLRGSKLYMDAIYRMTDNNGNGTETTKYVYTKDGARSYTKITDDDGESVAVYLEGNWAYAIYEEGEIVEGEKVALKKESDDLDQEEFTQVMAVIKDLTREMLTPDQPDKVKKEVKELNGKPYNAESYQKTIDKETGTVTCYYLNNVLKYIVYDSILEYFRVTVNDMSAKAKEDLLKVPDGYYVIDQKGNVYDENGKYLGNINDED